MTPSLELSGGRATIRLQRPEKRNRIEPDDLVALAGHLDEIAAAVAAAGPDAPRALVITAEGPSWCSGYHLGALADGARSPIGFGDVCDRIESLDVPTIAAIGGSVHGGGTDLAISCDFRVAAEGVVLGMPAARIGLQYYASGLRRFVQRIGPDATKRLFLTAETIPAAELLRIGYLTEVVPAERLGARVDELCAAVASLAPLAVVHTKRAINALAGPAPDLAAIEATAVLTARSEDHREAMRAMRERRPARFRGA
jgi:enoyl-CoA hydratase/carnithine racemase